MKILKTSNRFFAIASLLFVFSFTPVLEAKETPMSGAKLGEPLPANLFVELNKRINPAVVNISATVLQRPSRRSPRLDRRDPFFDFFEEFFGPQMRPHRGQPDKPRALGTGFLISPDGLILTNNHVVDLEGGNIKVALTEDPNKFYEAEVIGRDVRGDISLIKIDAGKKLPYLKLGSSEGLEVGQWVAAFGNPFGHSNTMTTGIISAKGRSIDELNRFPFLQTDASINPGNSGGPLVDTIGYVIGMNTAIDARAQGIGFSIPIDYVKDILPILEKGESVKRGFIGVNIMGFNPLVAAQLQVDEGEGALITQIMPDGPAEKSGLKEYDVIVKFGKKPVKSERDLIRAVQDTPVGKKSKITIHRFNKRGKKNVKNFDIVVGQHPEDQKLAARPEKVNTGTKAPFGLGFKVANSNDDLRREFSINTSVPKGPVVTSVERRSIASQAGLNTGDVILDVNKVPVKRLRDVMKNLRKGRNYLRVARHSGVALLFMDTKSQ